MFVEFDLDLYEIGMIEPVFVEETIGWANQEVLLRDYIAVREFGSDVPVDWVPEQVDYEYRDLPEPVPIQRTVLRWKTTETRTRLILNLRNRWA